ncbi:hypothetical protein LXL04_016168 [Taraxacum kok-saghyz]
MAFSSTSSVLKRFKYDVFLSFRGRDTRTNFIDHLYYALQQKGIKTYKDDQRINKGRRIWDELMGSIENSKFYIIVFSKSYASSSWCLNELIKIMECHKTTSHTAYPVFYDVEPSEIRNQSGAVGEAFAVHENEETTGKWRKALKEAADLAGWELKNTANGHEAEFIHKIAQELLLELRSINFNIDEKLVGIECRINDVVSSLGIHYDDDVRMIGIKGMGGGGKTTLARAIFDQISCQFEGKSFVENVREVSHASLSGLKSLQTQVLSDVFNDQGITISGVSDGKNMMKRIMHAKKVLLVLDDVDHVDQLEALVGDPNWFRPGSRIIITTRDEQVLIAKKVKLIHNVSLLSDTEAIRLFSKYAFDGDIPIHGYEELSGQVVSYAAGLPLTITILGSLLCGKSESEWIDALERLKSIPLMETLKKLEISYISLEEDYKEIFLDVACILRGWPKYLAIEALESCGFHARNGLRVLEQRSLITTDDHYYDGECIGMHDHIEEMGMNIVRRSHPDNPKKRSRLWIDDEVEDILINDQGTKATRCIRFDARQLNPDIIVKGLRKMKKLRVLDLLTVANRSDSFCSSLKNDFPNALRYLRWNNYPFRSLAKTFQANTLVGLGMAHSRIVQLWEAGERKVLNKLKFLDLSYSMLRTFDLALFPNLESLTLRGCGYLVELHMPVRCLKLRSFHLGNSKLNMVDLRMTPNLKMLVLDECSDLVELHMPGSYQDLRSLKVNGSQLKNLEIGRTPNLECLDIQNCYDLEELHMADKCQKLTSIDISFSKLTTIDLRLSPNLKKLDLKYNYSLVEIHTSIECLIKLVYIDLSGCRRFTSFFFHKKDHTSCTSVDESVEVGLLAEIHLIVEFLERCQFWYNRSFSEFQFEYYYNKDIPSITRNLEKIISVNLCASTNLSRFPGSICGLQRLRKLKLKSSIQEAPNDIDQLECLEELSLSSENIKHLPDSICMLKHLKSLKLKSCLLLEMVPEDIGHLESLETLTLSSTKIKYLPDSICQLKHLESLKLIDCSLLERLPEDIGHLQCLEKLILMDCMLLQDIPNSICKLKFLKLFYLCYCIRVEKLPDEIGGLECLKELDIEGTCISHLPHSILLLKGLRIIGSKGLLQSCGFASEVQNSICETFCYVEM